MLIVGLTSVLVVALAAGLLVTSRYLLPKPVADTRGIALQTVIIMVVLLVIAGGVAAVLLARGNQAVSDLEETEVSELDRSEITSPALCTANSGTWTWSNSANTDPGDPGSCS